MQSYPQIALKRLPAVPAINQSNQLATMKLGMASPWSKEWHLAIQKEWDSLQEHHTGLT